MPPRPTAIVLAAGLSRRAAPHHKLLLPAPDGSGRTVIRATVEALCGERERFDEIIVVTGHARGRVESALAGLDVRFTFAPDFAQGMGRSLAAGVRAASLDTIGFVVTPGDLPSLTPPLVAQIMAACALRQYRWHIIPTARGERGHPVCLGAWLRDALLSLTGDVGARLILQGETERARTELLEVGDSAILRDVDQDR